jgi:hypothetical protein
VAQLSVLCRPWHWAFVQSLRLSANECSYTDITGITRRAFHLDVAAASATLHSLTEELVTRAQGDVRDAAGRPGEHGQLAAVDPDKRLIALQLYDGVLKVCVRVGRLMTLQHCPRQQLSGMVQHVSSASTAPVEPAQAPRVPIQEEWPAALLVVAHVLYQYNQQQLLGVGCGMSKICR